METKKKEGFASTLGFILATAGSAVGLGNIWRFPYLAAKYGGGFFLLVYIILALTFGFTLMITELAIGRKTGKSVVSAFKTMDGKFGALGIVEAIVPIIIVPYYCVIGGWVIKYLSVYMFGHEAEAADDGTFFSAHISNCSSSTLFFAIFAVITAIVIVFGIEKGIETVSKFMMPALVVLIIGVAVYTMMIPGALDGIKYYLLPNFNDFSGMKLLKTVVAAMGQLFYSLSIAMGILITYGSYMKKSDSLEKSVHQISFFDTFIAFLAGLIIVPGVFAFSGGDAGAINAGPSLMFVTLPNVFASMRGGRIVGILFFLLVTLAALTSSIALLEAMVAGVMDLTKMKRPVATLVCFIIVIVLGLTSVFGYSIWSDVTIFGYQFLDFYDFISNNVIMPLVALLTCVVVGYVVGTNWVEEEVLIGQKKFAAVKVFRVMVKYVCPIGMIIILASAFVMSL
ncbi:MAG: sodium-dependent transporter [Lachnospiraceae bacterium]|nr:sodium-dependent transporter [Candidatus Colinaster equi]